MHARSLILLVPAALTAALIVGCASTSGVVTDAHARQVWAAGPEGAEAPTVKYTGTDGRQYDFHQVRHPVTLVVFSAPAGSNCCWLDPRVVSMWDRLRNLPVTVAQFSMPTEKCPHGPGCVEGCNIGKGGLVTFCDPQRIAWKAYGRPELGDVILLGSGNKILMKGSLNDSAAIMAEAERLGKDEAGRGTGNRIEMYRGS